jgi:hypothetical protein
VLKPPGRNRLPPDRNLSPIRTPCVAITTAGRRDRHFRRSIDGPRPGDVEQIAGPVPKRRAPCAVPGVVALASLPGEAATADALGQFVTQGYERPDPFVELGTLTTRQSLRVALIGRRSGGGAT